MPQIILKDRTGHLASYTFFTRYVNQYKKRHFHNSVNHQENLFHRKLITEVFKNSCFIEKLQKQSFADVLHNR